MTASLTRHPQLSRAERNALEALGLPLDRDGVVITITWGDDWRNASLDHTRRGNPTPIQWTADWYEATERITNAMSRNAMEHGPDIATELTNESDSGVLDDLAERIESILNDGAFDPDGVLTIDINGWALTVLGYMDGATLT